MPRSHRSLDSDFLSVSLPSRSLARISGMGCVSFSMRLEYRTLEEDEHGWRAWDFEGYGHENTHALCPRLMVVQFLCKHSSEPVTKRKASRFYSYYERRLQFAHFYSLTVTDTFEDFRGFEKFTHDFTFTFLLGN